VKTSIRIAALLVGGALFIGCDSKDNTAVTPPAMPTVTTSTTVTMPPPPATPAMPDTSGKMGQLNNAIDKGAASAKTEADKMLNSAPTTAPAIPGLGK
jgi:hypothetical protein